MKLIELSLSGFRAFAGEAHFDLSSDATIIVGSNGQGKTSIFDAVLWGLTGKVNRIGDDRSLVSLYSKTGEAWVKVVLSAPGTNTPVAVSRRTDGSDTSLVVEIDGRTLSGLDAAGEIERRMWPSGIGDSGERTSLSAAFTRSVYLQQDLLRRFVDSDTSNDRFQAVASLVGAGTLDEFHVQFDKSRTAWSRSLNEANERDLLPLQSERRRIREQLERLSATSSLEVEGIESRLAKWNSQLSEARLVDSSGNAVVIAKSAGLKEIDSIVRLIDANRQAGARKLDAVQSLRVDLVKPPPTSERVGPLTEAHNRSVEVLKLAQEAYSKAQEGARIARDAALERKEKVDQLSLLAHYAMPHIDGDCPVCGQSHDPTKTRERLRILIANTKSEEPTHLPDELREARAAVFTGAEREDALRAELVAEIRLRRDYEVWSEDVLRRAEEILGIPSPTIEQLDDIREQCDELGRSLSENIAHLFSLQREGESLSLNASRVAELVRRKELESKLAELDNRAKQFEQELTGREATRVLAAKMIEALRVASDSIIESRIQSIAPILQRIYWAIDPHPTLRAVRLVHEFAQRRGRLDVEIADVGTQRATREPSHHLSSSQVNALAVSLFLSLNLAANHLPLHSALLDDPLQSLDDINLLGLLDLLRKITGERQLFVSTHDSRFSKLLETKLRPTSEGSLTSVIELSGWSRVGPVWRQRFIKPDLSPLRLVV